jgi:2-hydroxyacyl-CoA lyase 1
LKQRVEKNLDVNEKLMAVKSVPMTYYSSYAVIKRHLPKSMIMIGEGANTMDIGRTIFTHEEPRCKLDAGTFGTMGIGLAALISARTTNPNTWGVCVMGDSAFGFSAMEC